jgi:hypothetical protein
MFPFSLFANKEVKPSKPKSAYSFCESMTATARSAWHIRPLTEKGMKPGGGADTLSLCDRNVSWDIEVEITDHHLSHCCQVCAKKFLALKN